MTDKPPIGRWSGPGWSGQENQEGQELRDATPIMLRDTIRHVTRLKTSPVLRWFLLMVLLAFLGVLLFG